MSIQKRNVYEILGQILLDPILLNIILRKRLKLIGHCIFKGPLRLSIRPIQCFVCLFDLILYVPSTFFQLYRDGSSLVEPVLS